MATTAGSTRINIDLALNTRGFRPLGRINGQLGEFEKSLDASNARVLAFGASAGAILAVKKAFTATIRSAIEVEKSLKDINVILQATDANLQKFGSQLFKIASETGQAFDVAAKAATELARQGLGVEETLKRTRDALILARLSGLDAADAVNALTAALNTFTKVGLDSTVIINKLANVDAAFAVSSEDLAKALGRVGSAAVSAGVDLDQLLAIVTTAQQKTARGGAVIGNSFKTIFTRIQRPRVIKELENLGIQVRNLEGDTLPAIRVLENLAKQFDNLSSSQRAQISELVGGVFQVNVLKAALSDLNREQGIYNRALGISIGSSDQAIRRNEELNQTLSAQFQKTVNTFKESAAELGTLTFGPALQNIFGAINSTFESAAGEGDLAKTGQLIGKSVFEAIGKFIGGPGLIIIGATLFKTFANLATFAADAFKTLTGLNKNFQTQLNLQKQIFGVLSENPDLMNRIRNGTLSVEDAHTLVLQRINEETTALDRQLLISQQIAATLAGAGVGFSPDFGATSGGTRKFGPSSGGGRSGGFLPNFANQELMGMMMGGYSSSQLANPKIKNSVIHNGRGGAFSAQTNGHEDVLDFVNSKGKKATAVIPPRGSGAFDDFVKALSGGYIPNFFQMGEAGGTPFAQARAVLRAGVGQKYGGATITRGDINRANKYLKENPDSAQAKAKKKVGKKASTTPFFDVGGYYGVLSLFGETDNNSTITASTSGITAIKGAPAGVRPEKIQIGGFQQKSFLGKYNKKDSQTNNAYAALIKKHMAGPLVDLTNEFFGPRLLQEFKPAGQIINKMRANQGGALLPKGAEGSIFEASINALTKNAIGFEKTLRGDPNATWDFEESGFAGQKLRDNFGFSTALKLADGKRSVSDSAMTSLANKVFTSIDKGGGGTGSRTIRNFIKDMSNSAAGGFIPSFSALHNAVQRERSAGVPANKIRVGTHKSLASGLNPMGLGVYNTRDEPSGLGQGVRRSLARGLDPRKSGIPNFNVSMGPNSGNPVTPPRTPSPSGPGPGTDPSDTEQNKNTNALIKLQTAFLGLQTVLSTVRNSIDENSSSHFKNQSTINALESTLTTFVGVATAGSLLAGGNFEKKFNAFFAGGGRQGGGGASTAGMNMFQRVGNRAGRMYGGARRMARSPLTLGGAAMGVGAGLALSAGADTLVNETFNASAQELDAATKNFKKVSESAEKNIGALNKFAEAAEQSAKVYHDSNASIGQVLQAQREMTKALSAVPTEVRERLAGAIDPDEINAAVQAGIDLENRNKQDAQTRQDIAQQVRVLDQRFKTFENPFSAEGVSSLVDNIGTLAGTEGSAEAQARQRKRDENSARNVAGQVFSGVSEEQFQNLSADQMTEVISALERVDPDKLSATQLQEELDRIEKTFKELEIPDTVTDSVTKGLETTSYGADILGTALAEEAIERKRLAEIEKEMAPIREALLKQERAMEKAVKDARRELEHEQKVRQEVMKIQSTAANKFLTATAQIESGLQQALTAARVERNQEFGQVVDNTLIASGKGRFTKGLEAGSQDLANASALESDVNALLTRAQKGGLGSVTTDELDAITERVRKESESAGLGSERGSALDRVALQLDALNTTATKLEREAQEQTEKQRAIAEAQKEAARQAQRLRAAGGVKSIGDPSALNDIITRLRGSELAGRIAQATGSASGQDSATVNRAKAIQDIVGGDLSEVNPILAEKAREAAARDKMRTLTGLNNQLAPEDRMSTEFMMEAAREQAASLFKGSEVEQNTKALESLTQTLNDYENRDLEGRAEVSQKAQEASDFASAQRKFMEQNRRNIEMRANQEGTAREAYRTAQQQGTDAMGTPFENLMESDYNAFDMANPFAGLTKAAYRFTTGNTKEKRQKDIDSAKSNIEMTRSNLDRENQFTTVNNTVIHGVKIEGKEGQMVLDVLSKAMGPGKFSSRGWGEAKAKAGYFSGDLNK